MANAEKPNMMLTIGVIVLTQALLMVGFWYFIVPKLLKEQQPQAGVQIVEVPVEAKEETADSTSAATGANMFKKDETDYLKERAMFNNEQLEGLAVHPIDDPDAYLVVSMGYEYLQKNKKLPEELGLKLGIVMDRLITFFGSQEITYLDDITNRDKIKEQVREIVNNVLTTGEITRVIFTQYIIQR